MATTSATLSTTITKASISGLSRKKRNVVHITGLNSFGGLKANNSVASLGLPVCTQQSFAKVVSSLKGKSQGQSGGALSATCNAAAEIFNIVLTINGLTLVGVAVGFVLLRMEAFVEEAAESE
ncbi:hypothetical protein ACHQM5_023365 [Ranunculus cassubicifolius]